MINRYSKIILVAGFGLMLSGCWESANVTFHQPGEYMGANDSLKTDSSALQERFSGQQDR